MRLAARAPPAPILLEDALVQLAAFCKLQMVDRRFDLRVLGCACHLPNSEISCRLLVFFADAKSKLRKEWQHTKGHLR
jgi:hypothetical protein